MILRVKYDDLKQVGTFVGTKKEEIYQILDNIEKLTNDVPNAWKGIDSDIFVAKSSEYIKNQKANLEKVGNLSQLLGVFSTSYKEKDNEWKEEMKKETMRNDRYQ